MLREDGLGIWPGFFSELRRLGYSESANLIVERYSAEGRSERFDELVGDVVARAPTLIVTNPNQFALLFAQKTTTIPIVSIIRRSTRRGPSWLSASR